MPKIGRYGHAKQYKRMKKAIKQVKGFLGRVLRDIDRQIKRQGLVLTQPRRHTQPSLSITETNPPKQE